MDANLPILTFDELGAPECSWREAQSRGKKVYLMVLVLILLIDLASLFINLANPPYSTVNYIEMGAEILVLLIIIPKLFGRGPGLRHLKIENNKLEIKSGIYYNKKVPLQKLEKISISKKNMGNRKLVLHYKNGRKEMTNFRMWLSFPEDRKKMARWMMELNDKIRSYP